MYFHDQVLHCTLVHENYQVQFDIFKMIVPRWIVKNINSYIVR